jgi:predicted N-acyltransferase
MKFISQLEPTELMESFHENPPEDFTSIKIDVDGKNLQAFSMRFRILTTVNERVKKILKYIEFLIPKPKLLFIGTTVSEYSIYPKGVDAKNVCEAILKKFSEIKSFGLIVKDIAKESTILSQEENRFTGELMDCLKEKKFEIIYGEALAYIHVDFKSIDEFINRFSKSRKKTFKRKLRSKSDLIIDQIKTGDEFFNDENIQYFYNLYLNVYNGSSIHFDKLTLNFFKSILQSSESGGIVFVFKHDDKIIGYTICFSGDDYFNYKYIGQVYPDSRNFNLYYVSWFCHLEYCIKNNIKLYIAGWTDPEIKSFLGSEFTFTFHAIYIRNPIIRFIFKKTKFLFESDKDVMEKLKK